jgi:beta-lactam-binding protein with PASTA domain
VVAAGTTVILYAGQSVSPDTETVPELTGFSYAQARDLLGSRGLFLRSDSTVLAVSDLVRVAFQSVAAGESARHGDVVAVTLFNDDNEEYGIY